MSEELVESPISSLGCSRTWFAPVWVPEACREDWGCPGELGRGVLGRGCSVPPLLPEGLGDVAAVPVGGLLGTSLPIPPLSRKRLTVPARQWGKANESKRQGLSYPPSILCCHPPSLPPQSAVPLLVLCLQQLHVQELHQVINNFQGQEKPHGSFSPLLCMKQARKLP